MAKKKSKASRRLKEKQLNAAKKDRKARKSNRTANIAPLSQARGFGTILKRNALPVAALLSGCFIFYLSVLSDPHFLYGFSVRLPRFEFPHFAWASQELPQAKKETKETAISRWIRIRYASDTKYSFAVDKTPPIFELPDPRTSNEIKGSFMLKVLADRESKAMILTKKDAEKADEGDENADDGEHAMKNVTPQVIIKETPRKSSYEYKPTELPNIERLEKAEDFRNEVSRIVKGTPMEAMVGDIVRRDRAVAAFLVGIAMKESKFGIYSPKKGGRECFNYWGYRGKEDTTNSGYSCFDNPSQAIQVVGDRIENFVRQGRTTPAAMVVWKCGYSCEGHSDESVSKWIADVSINYYRLNPGGLLSRL